MAVQVDIDQITRRLENLVLVMTTSRGLHIPVIMTRRAKLQTVRSYGRMGAVGRQAGPESEDGTLTSDYLR